MNAIKYLIIIVLFPVYLVTLRAILEGARRASSRLFSRIFLRDEHGLWKSLQGDVQALDSH